MPIANKIYISLAVIIALFSCFALAPRKPQTNENPPNAEPLGRELSAPQKLDESLARLLKPIAPAADNSAEWLANFAKMFRLCGAFKSFAIIEERATGTQNNYRVGDELHNGKISEIYPDRVLVETARGVAVITKEKTKLASKSAPTKSGEPQGNAALRFGGQQLSTNEWNFSRGRLKEYYQELLDRPERLVKVFDSLEPVYGEAIGDTDRRPIEGYQLNVQGEADFFRAVGLAQNDIIRTVNSIEMTNRYRAENLLRRFAADDLTVVILEIERNGETIKQVYYTDE